MAKKTAFLILTVLMMISTLGVSLAGCQDQECEETDGTYYCETAVGYWCTVTGQGAACTEGTCDTGGGDGGGFVPGLT